MRVGTVVNVADNSGPTRVRIIKILRKPPQSQANIGSIIIGSVIRMHNRPKFKVVRGNIVRGLVVRCSKMTHRKDFQKFMFQRSGIVIISKNRLPRATKIFGPIAKEIRELGFIRVVSLSTLAL